MEAVEQAMEASIGAAPFAETDAGESGFETERVADYLEQNAGVIEAARLNPPADGVAAEVAIRLRALAVRLRTGTSFNRSKNSTAPSQSSKRRCSRRS